MVKEYEKPGIELRMPVPEDGKPVSRLIKHCPPLDENSVYCNLLQCSHFAETSVAAEAGGELVGFISGYIVPSRPDTLFVWQVAVGEKARGQGLAGRMLNEILGREACGAVRFIETTITEDNEASWGLFNSLSKQLDAVLERSVMFDRKRHFDDEHDTEWLARIGPLKHQ